MLFRLVIVAFSIGSAVCAALAFRHAPPTGASPLEALPALARLGVLGQGDTASAAFELHNHSDHTVQITEVYGGCSCTAHELSASIIQPSEEATLTLTYSSESSRGPVSTNATVYYFVEPELQLRALKCTLVGEVEPNIRLSSERLQFSSDESARQVVQLRPGRLDAFRIQRSSATHPAFTVTQMPGSESDVQVEFDASAWKPVHGPAELVIVTSDKVAPVLRIPLLVTEADTR